MRTGALLRVGLWVFVAVALVLVFMAYLNPALIAQLANQLWSCF